MSALVDGTDVLRQRLGNQQLVGPRWTQPADVVAWLGAVQSQDYAGAKWALGQRLHGSTSEAIDRAFDAGAGRPVNIDEASTASG